jgi:hypothetical protein
MVNFDSLRGLGSLFMQSTVIKALHDLFYNDSVKIILPGVTFT